MEQEMQRFEAFVESELDGLRMRLLTQYAELRQVEKEPESWSTTQAGPCGQVCSRSQPVIERDQMPIEELRPTLEDPLPKEDTPLAEAMREVMPDEYALERATMVLTSMNDFDSLEEGFVAHQHSDDQLLIQERILAKDADVKSPHAVINWALMLDQLSAQFELDFGVTLTGSFMPSKPRAESELDMNIRPAWTNPANRKQGVVFKPMAKTTSQFFMADGESFKRTTSRVLDGEDCTNRVVLHPYRTGRVSWGMLTLAVVGWEATTMPLLLFDLGDWSIWIGGLTTGLIFFWIVDILVNCITGVDHGGVVDLRLKTSFISYAKSWLIPDTMIVIVDIIVLLAIQDEPGDVASSPGGQGMRLARALRLLRLVRLLRIYKASSAANFLVDYIRSPSLLIASKIGWTLLTILFINHYIACAWCAIAYFNVGSYTWIVAANLSDATFLELYLSSLHWSLTQFSPATNNIAPQNVLERIVAAFVVIFALLVFSSFVSSITNYMNQLRITNARMIEDDMTLRNFFEKRMISVDLSGRIQHLFKKGSGIHLKRPHVEDIPFLKEMPESLRIHLHNELYLPHFADMPAFKQMQDIDRTLFSKLCHHVFQERFYPTSFEVFVDGSPAKNAVINVNGDLNYSWMSSAWETPPTAREAQAVSNATTVVKVPLRSWLADAVIWSDWNHRGLLESAAPSEILLVDAVSFTHQCQSHGGQVYQLLRRVALLAVAYREQMSRAGSAVTDLPLNPLVWKNVLERAMKLQTMGTVINAMTRSSRRSGGPPQ
ncbi:unnamed protein product [Effrenium voratum]|nr:unnamed protein product [Effrenium voratum]